MPTPRNLFVTTALPFANGPFHVGHIMEYIQADIWVRFQRMVGNQVHFVCADDTHGAAIMLKAEAEGITSEQLIERIAAGRPQYLQGFHIEFDHWYSTHSPENKALSSEIYLALKKAGLIYPKSVEQFYDPVKKMFLPDRFIKGECPNCHSKDQYGDSCEVCGKTYNPTDLIEPYSVVSGAKPIEKESTHFFVKLADFEAMLQTWLREREREGGLQSEVVNKLQEWFADGLRSWDVSRDAPYFGFEIPDQPGKYFYVWVDAPIGYLSSFRDYCTAWNAKHPAQPIRFR